MKRWGETIRISRGIFGKMPHRARGKVIALSTFFVLQQNQRDSGQRWAEINRTRNIYCFEGVGIGTVCKLPSYSK